MGQVKVVVLVLVSILFLTVYATLTWFTTAAPGIDKIFTMCGGQKADLFSLTLSAISTTTTMVVNTFSHFSKVFDPKTYTDLREKILPVWNAKPEGPPPTRLERAWNTTKTVAKCAMMIGDLTTYSIAGGVSSGESVGGTIGNLIGWGASKLLDFGSKIKKIVKLQSVRIIEARQIDFLTKFLMPAYAKSFVNRHEFRRRVFE